MDHFPFYTGDYLRDTSFRSATEHGVYLLLIIEYMSSEKPLPADLKSLSKLCRITRVNEKRALSEVVRLYFTESNGLLHHKKCDEIISKYHEIVKKRSKAGLASASKKSSTHVGTPVEHMYQHTGQQNGNYPDPDPDLVQGSSVSSSLSVKSETPVTHTSSSASARELSQSSIPNGSDAWRDVTQCDPTAYETWLAWRESEHDVVPPIVRLGEAKFLAGRGTPEAQREFVAELIRLRFKRMHEPIRHKGREANGKKPWVPPKSADQIEAEAIARGEKVWS